MIRVLIVEDSPTLRKVLVHVMEQDPDILVVGEAVDGEQGVEMAIRLKPDLITMDVIMPEMDGLEATRRIMAQCPTPIIIITAHTDSKELNVAFESLQTGALDVIAKPDEFGSEDTGQWQKELLAKIKNLAGIRPRPIG